MDCPLNGTAVPRGLTNPQTDTTRSYSSTTLGGNLRFVWILTLILSGPYIYEQIGSVLIEGLRFTPDGEWVLKERALCM